MGWRCSTRVLGRESGSISVYVLVFLPALFMAVGLVLDGGSKVEAIGQARDLADNAARVGAQFSDPYQDAGAINRYQAEQAIAEYLATSSPDTNLVEITYPSLTTVRVVISIHVDYQILPGSVTVVGIGSSQAQKN